MLTIAQAVSRPGRYKILNPDTGRPYSGGSHSGDQCFDIRADKVYFFYEKPGLKSAIAWHSLEYLKQQRWLMQPLGASGVRKLLLLEKVK